MDMDFHFEPHMKAVIKTSLRQLAKVKPIMPAYDFEILIHAFIISRLHYCNALYAGISQSLLSRLQLLQNAAAHLLTGSQKQDYITSILASLHWLPVHFCIHFKFHLYVFKYLNGLAPLYLSNLLQPYVPSRSLRSADQSLLTVPKTKRIAGPKLWNELPLHVRQANSLPIFKLLLKTHYFSLAFNTV